MPLRVQRDGSTAWCTLDSPPLNLLEPTLIRSLRETFVSLAGDRSVRAAVIGGAGRAFTAGMDVRLLGRLDVPGARRLITELHDAVESVHRAPFPVLAAIQGPCLGAGLELALACDLRVAASDAALGLPEVRVGIPSVIEAALLPGLVGPGRAAEILLTGEPITAARALEWGLVNRVALGRDLRAAVETLLDRILACGPEAIRLQKELMIRWRPTDLAAAIAAGVEAFAAAYATDEPREGAAAFLEKRRPRFGAG